MRDFDDCRRTPTCRRWLRRLLWLATLLAGITMAHAAGTLVSEAEPATVRAFFASQGMRVLTFLGYSSTGYEHPTAMLERAGRVLDRHDPRKTIVNCGATAAGIGAVYAVAKRRGFRTTGIVSILARREAVPLSPHVDVVFYVTDAAWGGFLPGTGTLSPTSQAIVENSDSLVAIGGGDIARDELIAARRAGKTVEFIPADLNHQLARENARHKGLPVPTDFRGSAATALETGF